MRNSPPSTRSLQIAAMAMLPLALIGCGTGLRTGRNGDSTTSAAKSILTGRVMGGQQPISGSTIQLYAINTATLAGASTPELTSTVTTDAGGNFSLTGRYAGCPSGALVYLTATGGNAGAGTNGSIAEMAVLGTCGNLPSVPFITITEVTTVAAAYALAPFMADYAHVGANTSVASQLTGITNAFANAATLADFTTGNAPGSSVPSGIIVPTAEINTLANIIAACINGTTTCSTLFGLTTPSGGATPFDTIGALLSLAKHPGLNTTPLFNLQIAQSPFPAALTAAPADFSLALKLTGNNLSTPNAVAIDSSGNAWVTNETGTSLSQFSPTGAPLTGGASYTSLSGAQGLTIDPSGNLWVANSGANSIVKLTSTGALSHTTTHYTLAAPIDIAADARGNIWVANLLPNTTTGATVTVLNNAGTFTNALTANSAVSRPTNLAVDPSGNVWISNAGTGTLLEYNKTFAEITTGNGYADTALQSPAGIAFDASGNAWVIGQGANELSSFASTGAALAGSPNYTTLSSLTNLAVDSAGSIWATSTTTSGGISRFTAATGATDTTAQSLGTLNTPIQIAVDPSGSLWTANSGDNSVSIFLGAAAPTTTPLVLRTQ